MEEKKTAEDIVREWKHERTWPNRLEKDYGTGAALSFAAGIIELQEQTWEALSALERKGEGAVLADTHSWLGDDLPQPFRDRYGMGFLKRFSERVDWWADNPEEVGFACAHTVADEIILKLAQDYGASWIRTMLEDHPDLSQILYPSCDEEDEDEGTCNADYNDWAYALFDDADVDWLWQNEEFEESPLVMMEGTSYHFDHWFEPQFYMREAI